MPSIDTDRVYRRRCGAVLGERNRRTLDGPAIPVKIKPRRIVKVPHGGLCIILHWALLAQVFYAGSTARRAPFRKIYSTIVNVITGELNSASMRLSTAR